MIIEACKERCGEHVRQDIGIEKYAVAVCKSLFIYIAVKQRRSGTEFVRLLLCQTTEKQQVGMTSCTVYAHEQYAYFQRLRF